MCHHQWDGDNCGVQVADDEIYLVVNAGCREKDITHMQKHLDAFSVRTTNLSLGRS